MGDTTIRIPRELLGLLKKVAALKEKTASDYATEVLSRAAVQDFASMVRPPKLEEAPR